MTSISRQLELPYSVAQMYALVNDVAAYPEFVPWCSEAMVHQVNAAFMQASLVIGWKGVHHTFTTKNNLVENQSITMHLTQGLMKNLTGQWQFIPRQAKSCQVKFSIEMEFKSPFAALLFSHMIDHILNRVTDAFCMRAKVLYG